MTTKTKTSIIAANDVTLLQARKHDLALKTRVANAEADTQLLMQQLEEMGFSANPSSYKEHALALKKNGNTNSFGEFHQVTCPNQNKHVRRSSEDGDELEIIQSTVSEQTRDTYSLPAEFHNTINSDKRYISKSTKHRPITPLSLRGLSTPGKTERFKDVSKSVELCENLENGLRVKLTKSEANQNKLGHQELEHELLTMRRLLSQVEDELQKEVKQKMAALEEVKRLTTILDKTNIAKAELELKAEELNASKQKLNRRLAELKDEALRESNLRASLEESHATLLVRLQDMETVIENLRLESRTHTSGSNSLKSEIITLKKDYENEKSRREFLEKNYHSINTEKERLLQNSSNAQSENQRVSQDLTRLQIQYAELIRQLEQTQTITETLTAENKILEEEKNGLQNKVESLTHEVDKLMRLNEEFTQAEYRLKMEKSALDEDLGQRKTEVDKLKKENIEKRKTIESLEHELKLANQSLTTKNHDFMRAADNLEHELARLKGQLEAMETEKQNVLRDKENLLEEVTQTVDSLISERSRLQTELQAGHVEIGSLRATCSRLEQDKVSLLERLGSLQQQQVTQNKIEVTLNEMMEQKNRLAYDNGKLQSTINQLQHELSEFNKNKEESNQLKKLNQNLQAKYTKCQQELSEYKVSLQRLDSQSKTVMDTLAQKEAEVKVAMARTEEAEGDRRRLIAQLELLEGKQLHKVTNYQKNMEEAKNVNKEIASTLEAVMASHSQLQKIAENLQTELGKRDSQISLLKSSRSKECETMKQELKKNEEQLDALKEDLRKEKENNGKKMTKDLVEIRKQNENLSDRNQELVKSNTELRYRASDAEREKEELRSKLSGQQKKMEYLNKAKKQLEDNLKKMKTVREDIEELEQMRNEYMKKNKEQGETIGKFMSQISLLQDEMRQLASAYMNAQKLLKMKEEALEKERKIREEMRKRFTESLKREDEICKKSQISNDKLQEAHNESLEISKHLEEAHEWFRGKFDKLQSEITASKKMQATLERENMDQRNSIEVERSKAMDAAARAKEMIQNSRQTISRLSDFAELADADTKQQLADLKAELFTKPTATKLAILSSDKRLAREADNTLVEAQL